MRNIWLDGIMGVIVGDALGLPVQFLDREELDKKPVTDMLGYGTFNLPPGTWSDDGSLTMATLESLIENDGIFYKDIMEKFSDWLLYGDFTPFGESFDQGNTCVRAIFSYARNNDVNNCGEIGEYANGNGALMRILPICLYAYEQEKAGIWSAETAIEQVHKISALTHNHLRSQIACGIYYYMVSAILKKKSSLQKCLQIGIDNARAFYLSPDENQTQLKYYQRMYNLEEFTCLNREDIKSSGYVVDSIEAAVWCLITTNSLEEALLKAVNLGDDTDTVAAIAGGLAGLYYGYDAIPKHWLEQIQKREWVESRCTEMGRAK